MNVDLSKNISTLFSRKKSFLNSLVLTLRLPWLAEKQIIQERHTYPALAAEQQQLLDQ